MLLGDRNRWIPSDLPEVANRVLKVSRVAAPKRLLRRFDDASPRAHRLRHDGIDLREVFHIVAQAQLGRTPRALRQAGVVGQVGSRPDGELEPSLEVEECDGPSSNSVPTMPLVANPRPSR